MSPDGPHDLAVLDEAIDRALASGDESGLRVVGYGEISSAVAWPTERPEVVCKRLPLFDSRERIESYRACFGEYLDRLRGVTVNPLSTSLRHLERSDGRYSVYCVQPILPQSSLAPNFVKSSTATARSVFTRILDAIEGCVDRTLGLDAQLSNWALDEREGAEPGLVYLDLSTPLLRDERSRERLDTDLFLASLPWLLRPLVKLLALPAILDKYYRFRDTVLDLAGNLYKERLDSLVPVLLDLANPRLGEPLSEGGAREYYRTDARMWALLQRLRRIDRFWQRRIRRRPYAFLLPPEIERHV